MVLRSKVLVFALLASVSFSTFSAEARRHAGNERLDGRNDNRSAVDTSTPTDDSAIVDAVNNRKGAYFIAGADMEVVTLLPDDTSGLEHQKFNVRLSNGQIVMAVYNLDMCERVPVKKGDRVGIAGQFIWTKDGGLLHWLHRDPRKNRPDGYVELNGKFYCK